MSQGKLELLVPSLVIAEFERNRSRVEASVTTSVTDRFRQLRTDVVEYGDTEHLQILEDMSRQIPLVSSGTLQNFVEVSELLDSGCRLEVTSIEIEGAMNRGLENKAPYRLTKNSTADALIIELYGSALRQADHLGDQQCFVTSNYLDFSELNGDRRRPHQDLSSLFAEERSDYYYGIDGLNTALLANLGDEFTTISEETVLVREEPRTLTEILEAEQELYDKVWYVRQLIRNEKIEAGEHDPLPSGLEEQAGEAMRAIEECYGIDNVGPWDDWGWGFINGKLSALRWVIGNEWDFLDT
jgi:hypothetical protein